MISMKNKITYVMRKALKPNDVTSIGNFSPRDNFFITDFLEAIMHSSSKN